MNVTLVESPWDTRFPMDAVTPMTSVHHGIEYPGEVIRARRWSSRLGGAPVDGCQFKIVLLLEPLRNGLPGPVHHRTAVCVPAPGSRGQARRIIGEITAAKRAAYLTRQDVDATAINSALRERQQYLEGQLFSEESARLTKGVIYVDNGPGPCTSDIYTGSEPGQWMEGLAKWLLARSYSSIPLATHNLAQPIRRDDCARLFASIFKQSGSDPELLARLGPALGPLPQDSGRPDDLAGCQVFSLIRSKLGGEPASFDDVHRYLAYDVGLTAELASLFLLSFVSQECPEHQIRLKDDAMMLSADGTQLLGARLTSDLIPLLAWEPLLASKASDLGPISEPRFIDARHHLSALCPELASSAPDMTDESLARSLESISQHICTASNILRSLGGRGESHGDAQDDANRKSAETGKLRAALERLGLVSGSGYAEIYHSVRSVYPVLPHLQHDLETLRQLVKLENDAVEIFQAQGYIANAQVPPGRFPSLAVDRETLLTGLFPSRLVQSRSRRWSAVARDAEVFNIRYTQAYREHHRQFHDALPGFQSGLLAAKKKVAALEFLNTIDELGPSAGNGLKQILAALPLGPVPCSFQGTELDLSNEPCCPECRISLDQPVHSAELARLAPQVDLALGGKTQELSRLLVEKVLSGKTAERWREFLQIVQASELSSLANTLDSDLVCFIKQVLD